MKVHEKNFEEIYNLTYQNSLKFIIVKTYDINDVNDIVQDTYFELLKKLKKVKHLEIENIDNYICGIADNIIKRRYHSKKLELVSDEFDENIEDIDAKNIDEDFITEDNVQKVWKYIKQKDVITFKIFYLYYVSDMKISDIANTLGISESNVKHKLYRTIAEIQKRKDVIGYEK